MQFLELQIIENCGLILRDIEKYDKTDVANVTIFDCVNMLRKNLRQMLHI